MANDKRPDLVFAGAALIVGCAVGWFLHGAIMPGKPGPEPTPIPPAVSTETARHALLSYSRSLSNICNEVAAQLRSGELKEKGAVIRYMNGRFDEQRPKAFRPVGELLDKDWSPETFDGLAKGFKLE